MNKDYELVTEEEEEEEETDKEESDSNGVEGKIFGPTPVSC